MNTLLNPIDRLRDIHLPEDPGFWPPAIGWWLVSILSLLVITSLCIAIRRWYRQTLPLKDFKRQILSIPLEDLNTESERQSAIASMSSAVKQLCVLLLGREKVSSVSGPPLLTLLDTISASTSFSLGPGKMLAAGSYQPAVEGNLAELRHVLVEELTKRSVLRNAREIATSER